jgi:PAT family beta-lactamase induction signal transducer AmpG
MLLCRAARAQLTSEHSPVALSNNRSHRIITFCALYFAQGIPWGFMLLTLPSYLIDKYGDHFGDDEIGLLKAIILIPWSFKLIWAPIMDSFTIRSMGRRRAWIIGAELMMALTLLGLIGLGDLSDQLTALLYMYFLHNCFASLQDVCTDAMAVDLLPANEQGQMNGMMWGSKLVGKAGGAWALSYVINWGGIEACVAVQIALLVIVMAVPLIILERPGERRLPWSAGEPQGTHLTGSRDPAITLTETLRAIGLPTLSIFIVFTLVKLFGTGINEVVVNTLYIKQLGWSDIEFTTASGLYTLGLVIAGAFVGGMFADRYGRRLVLCIGYGGFSAVAIVFALCPHLWGERWFTLSYVLSYEMLSAVGSVGFLSMAMRISWSTAAATVFTVYMTLSNVSHVVGNWLAGPVRSVTSDYAASIGLAGTEAELYSYQLTIGFAGLISLPALLLLLRVRTAEVDAAKAGQGDAGFETNSGEMVDVDPPRDHDHDDGETGSTR